MSPLKLLIFLLPCLFCFTPVYGTGILYTIRYRSKNGDEHAFVVALGEAYQILSRATEFSLGAFGLGEPKYNRVVLFVQSFEEHHMPSHTHVVASTSDNVITLNFDYFQRYHGAVMEEFSGIVYHESARVWQNNGNGQAPTGLLTGIADYVRMKAGYTSNRWPRRGSGSQWDQGYAVTAYFLEYCNSLRPGGNFVCELNAMMKHSYTHDYFRQLLGRSVHELWDDYLSSYRHDMGEVKPTLHRLSSPPKRQFGAREGTVNSVLPPRLSEEAYKLVEWYK